jgi:dipeptidyl aminopeptidase/acylaminoacyl peptidase
VRLLRRSELSRCVWLLLLAVVAHACDARADERASPSESRRVTVPDMIQMTRWADREYFLGGESTGRVGLFSPDHRHFIMVLKRGNIARNTVDYSLLLFRTSTVFRRPAPRVLLRMSSSSNRDAITQIKWLDDSQTIVFIGERPGEAPEVYSLNIRTAQPKRLTHHSTPIISYDVSGDGRVIVYQAAVKHGTNPAAAKEGILITSQSPYELARCDCGPEQRFEEEDNDLFVQTVGRNPSKIYLSDSVMELQNLSVSRNGRYALVSVSIRNIPAAWAEYKEQHLHSYVVEHRRPGMRSNVRRYMLLDTRTLQFDPLLNTPISFSGEGFAWARDGKSLVLSGAYLPLDIADPKEREVRKRSKFVVEIRLPGRAIEKITGEDLKVARLDERTGRLLLEPSDASASSPTKAYERTGDTWHETPITDADTNPSNPVEVTLEEDINTPPKIFVSEPKSTRRAELLDLNPSFARLQLGKVEGISWKATDAHEVTGGLYLPPKYSTGTRYPLVIQTHGFRKDRFWIDGPWSSAFAAMALAAKGIVVLQVGGSADQREDMKYGESPEEARRQMAAYEGAIDYLDSRGLIDRNQVGIIGFSRTVFYVAHTLTNSRYHFVAATLADGFDGSYLNYLFWPIADFVNVNGGPPIGPSFASWLKNSPGFNLDKVQAAVRLENYGPGMFLQGWQLFSGLSVLDKPVDFIWLPYGSHTLVKPWERFTSQQGNVDWFSFWLKNEADPDPAKREQYVRWEGLRALLHRNSQN